MSSPLYIGDVPQQFHYVEFTDYGFNLYNSLTPNIGDTCYRFYSNVGSDIYVASSVNETIGIVYDYPVSNDVNYRNDIYFIYIVTFILVVCGVFLINLITRCIRKGGLFG